MKQSKYEEYSANKELMLELKENNKIFNEIFNGLYVDDSLKKLLTLDQRLKV